jgi:hypothetical protein
MLRFHAKTTLVSLMSNIHTNLSTHARGNKIIDHIFGSPSLIHHVDKCGYLPFYQSAWPSDHRGLYIDILGLHVPNYRSQTSTRRILSSKNTKAIKQFLSNINRDHCSQLLTDLYHLESHLEWTAHQHDWLEQIDQTYTTLLLAAESKLTPHFDTPWSTTLDTLCQIKILHHPSLLPTE